MGRTTNSPSEARTGYRDRYRQQTTVRAAIWTCKDMNYEIFHALGILLVLGRGICPSPFMTQPPCRCQLAGIYLSYRILACS